MLNDCITGNVNRHQIYRYASYFFLLQKDKQLAFKIGGKQTDHTHVKHARKPILKTSAYY